MNEPQATQTTNGLGLGVRTATVTGLVLAFGASSVWNALRSRESTDPVTQPIAFNHKKHVEEQGLGCEDCHSFFKSQAFSGIPDTETCGMCHAEPQGKSEEEKRVVEAVAAGKPIAWKPLFRQPAHVYYSHRRHVVVAGLDCATCHGDIGSSERPPERVARLTMNGCIDCHRKQRVSTDCTTCHR